MYKWRATYHWKALNNFTSNLTSIGSLHTKLWASKVVRVPILEKNDIWVLVPWPGIEYTIRGKVVASPKSRLWWVLWKSVFTHGSSMHQKCSNYALTNLLFVLCRSMWIIELLVTLPHLEAPTCPFTPKVLQIKERAPTPYPSIVFTFRLAIEFIKDSRGALGEMFLFVNT